MKCNLRVSSQGALLNKGGEFSHLGFDRFLSFYLITKDVYSTYRWLYYILYSTQQKPAISVYYTARKVKASHTLVTLNHLHFRFQNEIQATEYKGRLEDRSFLLFYAKEVTMVNHQDAPV